jgi:diadenosine tetraphosphate (Ap4A) HIT family hydrolase
MGLIAVLGLIFGSLGIYFIIIKRKVENFKDLTPGERAESFKTRAQRDLDNFKRTKN